MKSLFKIFLPVLALLLVFLLTSCNSVVPNLNSITLKLDEKFDDYMFEKAPDFEFKFNGNLNTVDSVNKTYYTVFSYNEDDILSEALTMLFDQYKDSIKYEIVNTDEVKMRKYSHLDSEGNLYNVEMVCDDGKVYDEVAYISLPNGLKLTVDYCRFISNGVTYYTWRYSRSIAMYLYYPLMVVDDNGIRKIVLLTLPNMVSYTINPDQKLASLLTKDTYLDSSFYTFEYFDDGNDKVEYVLDYYKDYNLSKISDNVYNFVYLNSEFKLMLNENSFVIEWIKYLK